MVWAFLCRGGRFVGFIPANLLNGLRFFIWPKESRRRYRTAILAVFLLAFLAANLNYPLYWNKFADWANPKLDAIDMPEAVRRLDKWYVLKNADDILNVPRFWNVPFSLGLDLQGGIHLLYKADLSGVLKKNYGDAMQGLRDVIERRVNIFGVREPQVIVQEKGGEYRLLVELAGIKDFSKAVELIGQTPFLEFREKRSTEEQRGILKGLVQEGQEITDAQLAEVCERPNPEFLLLVLKSQGEDPCFAPVQPSPLTGKYLKNAAVQFDPNTNLPAVGLELDSEGAQIFEEVTARNVGKPLAIYLDGILINWPNVQEKISGGRAQITGFNVEGAKAITRNLNAGALPVPITLISQQSIGASLGEESLARSLRAGIIGLIAVMLFMVLLYRLSGLVAVIALLVYLILLLAVFKLLPVTLTLPGIAGLILSLGMAVDANVLVFERLREELLKNKEESGTFFLTLKNAYERAWPSIRDGNVSTLFTCAVLFWFSTSFVKGFALTLGLGVLVSMFTAMIVTRYLMRMIGEGRLGRKYWFWIR